MHLPRHEYLPDQSTLKPSSRFFFARKDTGVKKKIGLPQSRRFQMEFTPVVERIARLTG